MTTAAAEPGVPSSGWVHRVSNELTVHPPPDMPASTWRTLEQDLLLHAQAVAESDGSLRVPVQNAHRLVRILEQPWPAGRWPWQWSPSATAAANQAAAVNGSILRILQNEPPTPEEVDNVVAAIRASGFSRTLLPAQRDAVAGLVIAEGGGNFSVPGSGKTTMTLAVYVALRAQNLVDRMLVVAPQSAYEAWAEESRDCFEPSYQPTIEVAPRMPRRATEIVVINYERAAQASMRAAIDGWSRGRRLLIVFDEAHRAKRGNAGEHGRGAIDLAQFAERRMVLTGTPMPNNIDDLAAILDLAWPGHGNTLSSPHTPGSDRAWVRITKDQLELEPAEVVVQTVSLDEHHRRIYEAVARGLATDVDALVAHPEFARRAIARLVACASNPALLAEGDSSLHWIGELPAGDLPLAELLRDLPASIRPAKLLAAAQLAAEHAARGDKLLVWTNYLGNIRELERLLAPHNPAVITGAVARDEPGAVTDRVRQLERFRDDPTCSVLLATPQTLGEGVSLHHACQSQVHIDRTFNAGLFLQSLDRTHRVGMPEGTRAHVTLLVSTGTIDERIHESLTKKILAMDEVLRDPTLRRLAEPNPTSSGIGPEEIAALLAHLA